MHARMYVCMSNTVSLTAHISIRTLVCTTYITDDNMKHYRPKRADLGGTESLSRVQSKFYTPITSTNRNKGARVELSLVGMYPSPILCYVRVVAYFFKVKTGRLNII
jgi:hypothetical protein